MTQLSRAATLGIAREVTLGQYLPPTNAIPFTKATFEDVYAQLKDESVRGDDSILHGMYRGLYQQYIQGLATSLLTQPLPFGGASFALTMSQSGFYKGARDLSGAYAAASFSLSGIANATDGGGVIQATVKNLVQSAY